MAQRWRARPQPTQRDGLLSNSPYLRVPVITPADDRPLVPRARSTPGAVADVTISANRAVELQAAERDVVVEAPPLDDRVWVTGIRRVAGIGAGINLLGVGF